MCQIGHIRLFLSLSHHTILFRPSRLARHHHQVIARLVIIACACPTEGKNSRELTYLSENSLALEMRA
jgi:hypothetical protein